MGASFPPDRWPAQEIVEPDGAVRLVLKDGTEIHRISPPSLIYDLATGKPCGGVGRDGKILPLSQRTVDVLQLTAATGMMESAGVTCCTASRPNACGGF